MANEKPLNITHEAFIGTCRFLMNRITEALVRAESARMLLIQHGVCSDAEFDEMMKRVQAHWDTEVAQAVDKAQKESGDEALRRLLEQFQGPSQ